MNLIHLNSQQESIFDMCVECLDKVIPLIKISPSGKSFSVYTFVSDVMYSIVYSNNIFIYLKF